MYSPGMEKLGVLAAQSEDHVFGMKRAAKEGGTEHYKSSLSYLKEKIVQIEAELEKIRESEY